MDKIYVVYWSQTGNTEVMAEAVSQGIRESGKEAETLTVSQITADTLKEAQAFALGCPAMGDEVLEESEMEPFMEQLDPMISGKQIGLFGSYGWGGRTVDARVAGPRDGRRRSGGRRRRYYSPGNAG